MNEREILEGAQFDLVIRRLCCELIENHDEFSSSVIIGLQPRGIFLAKRIVDFLEAHYSIKVIHGNLDVTFHRDDFRRKQSPLIPNKTNIDFIIEGKKVVLIDDVLYTGRTIRSGMDAMLAFGRPTKVELLVLIDRRYSRDLPIQPDYTGLSVDTIARQRVSVKWKEVDGEDKVALQTIIDNG
ncbi:MAG: bifunctional pyr operon transcriptional regulator/uracil phosphoribosyltransferase PyrR [Vicingaceae bacterium]